MLLARWVKCTALSSFGPDLMLSHLKSCGGWNWEGGGEELHRQLDEEPDTD